MPIDNTLALTKRLIACPSVTPADAGCQNIIADYLRELDFVIESLPFADVTNLWATRISDNNKPLLVFAGHTDVVPPGDSALWHSDPFLATEKDGYLYGRGAADMKGSLAAMLTATAAFLATHPKPKFNIGFLITSDEEGRAINGTAKVIDYLQQQQQTIDWCIVGEPSSSERIGDVIKNGRRGSLTGQLTVIGQQGHVAYPELANNPIHAASSVLHALCAAQWDNGNAHFPPTSMQISNIHAGNGVGNVIPAELQILFNFRFSTATTADELKATVTSLLDQHGLNYQLDWTLFGQPFLTQHGHLLDIATAAVHSVTGYASNLSTAGGTSDGRFIAPTGAQVIELGPVNKSIHQVNEHVRIQDLEILARIYERILTEL